MGISFKEIEQAVGEWDFAMIASSYGHQGTREIVARAIQNLPTPELDKLRVVLAELIKEAVARTAARIVEVGVVMDVSHPTNVRAGHHTDPGTFFYKKDRQ